MPLFSLRDVLASNAPAHRDDTKAMKRALGRLGHYKFRDHESDHEPSPYPNFEMFEGLKRFQKQVGLRPDGTANPNGPTAHMLNAVLDEKSGSARHRPAFRLAQPIGARSANDETDLKGTRPVLEKLLGERRGDTADIAADITNGIRRAQMLFNLPATGTITPGDETHKRLARAAGYTPDFEVKKPEARRMSATGGSLLTADIGFNDVPPAIGGTGDDTLGTESNRHDATPDFGRMSPKAEALEAHRGRKTEKPAKIPLHARTLIDPHFDDPIQRDDSETFDKLHSHYDFDPDGAGHLGMAMSSPRKAAQARSMGIKIINNVKQWQEEPPRPDQDPLTRDEGNAVQHALWHYRMTKRWDYETAKAMGDAHEVDSLNAMGDTLKDLHNNEIGRRLALDPDNAGRRDRPGEDLTCPHV